MISISDHSSPLQTYDSLEPRYDILHARFLRMAGGEAQSVVEGAVTALLRPGQKVLDAGCGTGRMAFRLLAAEPEINMTLVDTSPAMIGRSRGLSARRVHARLESLPFHNDTFDIAAAFWSIEASKDPLATVCELVRVTRPDGMVALVFCAATAEVDLIDRLVMNAVRSRATGQFLDANAVCNSLRKAGASRILKLPCRGPAVGLLAKKEGQP